MMIPPDMRHAIDQLFRRMDRAYDQVAEQSGFKCRGCQDNCCLTRFYHHTLLEVLYIRSGLKSLPPDRMLRIRASAQSAIRQTTKLQQSKAPLRVMCPLNDAGWCVLYDRRPMICRLHGIAHTLQRPDGQVTSGPGCDDYYRQCGDSGSHTLNRTPFYVAMAELEGRLRAQLNYHRKIKMTVAEIIIDDRFDHLA
jgi:Fe-S-cluster containining protein